MTDPFARFAALVQGPEGALAGSLDEAALLIAAAAKPGLDVDHYRRRLDELAAGCRDRTLDGLVRHLYEREGFAGNHDDYYDPRNSYLDDVIDRRVGIPITLAVVLIEVGRRLGVELAGVGMPGHFLVRHPGEPPVIVDPFAAGAVVSRSDCEARFHAVQGPEVPFQDSFLDPIGPRALLTRMLANLRQIHASSSDGKALERVLRLRTAIPGATTRERLDLADVLAARGRFGEAATALDALVPLVGDDGDRLRARASLLRARLN